MLALFLILSLTLQGQDTIPQSEPHFAPIKLPAIHLADSSLYKVPASQIPTHLIPADSALPSRSDTALQQSLSSKLEKEPPRRLRQHNPNTALILSAVLPGSGQIYNKQAWKIPIIYAGFGGVGWFTYSNYVDMKQCKDEYLYRVNHDGMPYDPELMDKPTANIYNLYESYNKTFQLSVIIGVAVYGLNLLDAYIFGHLFDYDMSDDISFSILPTVTPMPLTNNMYAPTMGFTLRF